jgi:hypothetical protein
MTGLNSRARGHFTSHAGKQQPQHPQVAAGAEGCESSNRSSRSSTSKWLGLCCRWTWLSVKHTGLQGWITHFWQIVYKQKHEHEHLHPTTQFRVSIHCRRALCQDLARWGVAATGVSGEGHWKAAPPWVLLAHRQQPEAAHSGRDRLLAARWVERKQMLSSGHCDRRFISSSCPLPGGASWC